MTVAKRIRALSRRWGAPACLAIVLAACGGEAPVATPTAASSAAADEEPATAADAYPAPAYPAPEESGGTADGALALSAPAPMGTPDFEGVLAFHTARFGELQLATMDGQGTVNRLAEIEMPVFEPSWSPDCQSVAFTAGLDDSADFDLYTVAGGGEPRLLRPSPDTYNWAPAWSPDGQTIAYQNNQDGLMNICFTDPAGADLGCLVRDDFSNAMPAWSPDGDTLAFGSNRDGDWDIFATAYPPGEDLTRITDNEGISDFYPAYSLDGSSIAYASQQAGTFDLYVIDAAGGSPRQLTSDGADDTTPVWVGEDRIVFASSRGENWDLYVVSADGGDLLRITDAPGEDKWPAWCAG